MNRSARSVETTDLTGFERYSLGAGVGYPFAGAGQDARPTYA